MARRKKDGTGQTGASKGPKLYDVRQHVVQWALDTYGNTLHALDRQGKVTYTAKTTKGTDAGVFTVTSGVHKGGVLFLRTWCADYGHAYGLVKDGKHGVLVNSNTKTGKRQGLPYARPKVSGDAILALRRDVALAMQHLYKNGQLPDLSVGIDK